MRNNIFRRVFGGIFHALILTIFMLGPQRLVYGAVTKSTSCRPTGGISKIFHIQKADLDDSTPITWDGTNDYEISDFTFKSGKNFHKLEFTRKTANFNQTRAENGAWTQVIQWNIDGMVPSTSEQLQVLEDTARCEQIVIVVAMENGSNVVLGIRKYNDAADTSDYAFVEVEPFAGVADDSGTDPTADKNVIGDGLQCVVGRRAHFYTGTLAALEVAGA